KFPISGIKKIINTLSLNVRIFLMRFSFHNFKYLFLKGIYKDRVYFRVFLKNDSERADQNFDDSIELDKVYQKDEMIQGSFDFYLYQLYSKKGFKYVDLWMYEKERQRGCGYTFGPDGY